MPKPPSLLQFHPEPGTIYLNSATYGLPPQATLDAMHKALVGWQKGQADWIQDWDLAGEACRRFAADLLKAETDEIALMPAVSVATAIVATAVPEGGEVLVASGDFTSVIYPFLEAERLGRVKVREAPLRELADAVGPETRLVAVSHVQSASGEAVDVNALCQAAENVGARVFLDLSQSLGVVPFDVNASKVDFVACAAYKWLCCPRGTAFLYVRRTCWQETSAVAANWRAGDDPYGRYYGTPMHLAPTAARYDVSLAWHPWVGAKASLQVLTETDDDIRFELAHGAASRFTELMELPPPDAGIVSVATEDGAGEALERERIVTSARAGKVRLSFHYYNTMDDAEKAAAVLKPFRSSRS